MKLLIIDGPEPFDISRLCGGEEYVVHAETCDNANAILNQTSFDVVIVDVTSLSDVGFEFIRRWVAARHKAPIVALTGRHDGDRVRALSLGADDAITQPADAGELRTRIAAVVGRSEPRSKTLIKCGDLALLLESREVWFRNMPIYLSGREYSILETLALRPGLPVTTDALLVQLYGGSNVPSEGIIGVFMANLRRKLSKVGADNLIFTVRGKGYKLRQFVKETSMPSGLISDGAVPRPPHSGSTE